MNAVCTYAYGAKAPIESAAVVSDQIFKAHRYQNLLVEIERDRREATKAVLREVGYLTNESDADAPVDAEAFERGWIQEDGGVPGGTRTAADKKKNPKTKTKKPKLPSWLVWQEQQLAEAAKQCSGAEEELAKKFAAAAQRLADIDATAKARSKQARAECGVYWGTYLTVEDAVARAKASGGEVHFHKWRGAGKVSVQIQHGIPVRELLEGKDTRVRIVPDPRPHPAEGKPGAALPTNPKRANRRWLLYLRVGSVGRAPLWAVFPFYYHRPLPLTMGEGENEREVRVRWVHAACRRVATHTKWKILFVLDGGRAERPAPTKGRVAIDVGWRKFPDGMRVAVWTDDQGQRGELRLPKRLLERWEKIADLQSIRGKAFNEALAYLLGLRREVGDTWPEWLRDATQHAHVWRDGSRLNRLVLLMRETLGWSIKTGPGPLPGHPLYAMYETLEAWRKQDTHLYEWQENSREGCLAARRDIYRNFACEIAAYREIIVERLALKDFADHPNAVNGKKPEGPATKAARPRRSFANLYGLLGDIRYAGERAGGVFKEVDPGWTTMRCSKCGHVENQVTFDAAREVEHTCTNCGERWDQEFNATENLLFLGDDPEALRERKKSSGGARKQKKEVERREGESAVQARRRVGAEKRRQERMLAGRTLVGKNRRRRGAVGESADDTGGDVAGGAATDDARGSAA